MANRDAPRHDFLVVFDDGSKAIASSWADGDLEAERYGMSHAASIGNGRAVVSMFALDSAGPGNLSVRQIFPMRSSTFAQLAQ